MRDSGGSRLRDQADLGSQECGKHSRAIALIEKRRDDYIRDYCQVHGDGHWVGTNAQNEYVGELDDIIEMLRSDTPANCPAPVSPSPPASAASHPSLASAASGMLTALMKITKRLDDQKVHGIDPSQEIEDLANDAIAAAKAVGIKVEG